MIKITVQITEDENGKCKVNINVPKEKELSKATLNERKGGAVVVGQIEKALKEIAE